jgi:hypothetical protein
MLDKLDVENHGAESAGRDKVLLMEFLDRFEHRNDDQNYGTLDITHGMAHALYNTLRTDGH